MVEAGTGVRVAAFLSLGPFPLVIRLLLHRLQDIQGTIWAGSVIHHVRTGTMAKALESTMLRCRQVSLGIRFPDVWLFQDLNLRLLGRHPHDGPCLAGPPIPVASLASSICRWGYGNSEPLPRRFVLAIDDVGRHTTSEPSKNIVCDEVRTRNTMWATSRGGPGCVASRSSIPCRPSNRTKIADPASYGLFSIIGLRGGHQQITECSGIRYQGSKHAGD
jgi:hypothetical protein